ncbi:recombinase family protein [Variovorax sp. J2P1-59]|uniref:recombinase family protein n=1 Tax=Variovorax flavidus TaxID=3053501 RepID=UPI00257922B1|nr:recombinase family protein [Variovorax sp. J2P1-59]MDM0073981.1 recombinase family protein [Variovorax sp. J2P1-59]
MSHLAYYRVSTNDQSIEAQRTALGSVKFSKEFSDVGVSGGVPAAQRPGFAALLSFVREGDTIHVYALDRLGRDALDVQATVRDLLARGVSLDVKGLGVIAKGVGEIIVAVLAQVADMERQKINERTAAGRAAARASLAATGKTQHGKTSLGRRPSADAAAVVAWRNQHGASQAQAAAEFGISVATVKRYCASV